MEQVNLEGFLRKSSGKGVARSLRREGSIPAIFYSPESDSIPLSVSRVPLEKILKKQAGENTLYQLTIKGDNQEIVKTVMLKELQKNPLSREILHADFYEVSLTKEIDITVGLKVIGKAPGVEDGGFLQEISRELHVRCLPTHIPDYIEVDVSTLAIGDSLHVQDLKLPEGIQVLSDAQLTLVTLVPPLVEEKAAIEEAVAGSEVEVAKKGKSKTEEEG